MKYDVIYDPQLNEIMLLGKNYRGEQFFVIEAISNFLFVNVMHDTIPKKRLKLFKKIGEL